VAIVPHLRSRPGFAHITLTSPNTLATGTPRDPSQATVATTPPSRDALEEIQAGKPQQAAFATS
jgi:hypothetical protein